MAKQITIGLDDAGLPVFSKVTVKEVRPGARDAKTVFEPDVAAGGDFESAPTLVLNTRELAEALAENKNADDFCRELVTALFAVGWENNDYSLVRSMASDILHKLGRREESYMNNLLNGVAGLLEEEL